MWTRWSPVCWDGVSQDSVCQQLDCGPPTKLNFMPPNLEEQQAWAMRCEGMERCHWVAANCSQQAIIACSGEHGFPKAICAPTAPTCCLSSHFRARAHQNRAPTCASHHQP